MTKLGRLVRGRRRELGLTQSALGARCGLYQRLISRIECGQTCISFGVAEALAVGLEVPLEVILDALPRSRRPAKV